MAIDLVTQYQGLVDEKFSAESKRSLVTNKDYKWTGAHSIKIYKVSTAEMNDYGRNGGSNRYGTPEDLDATTEEMVLKKDRSFTFVLDKLDQDETGLALAAGTALERQIREKVIPEVDTYTYNVMAGGAGFKPRRRGDAGPIHSHWRQRELRYTLLRHCSPPGGAGRGAARLPGR